MNPNTLIPVVLFAYARPDHLRRTLACLRENNIPLLYAFADGPKTPDVAERVNKVHQILREIDWCEVHLVERTENLGLGKSIFTGVTEVFEKHDTIIVFEDDLICVPGTYQYICAALRHYKDDPRVMSITGYTDPQHTPSNIIDQPYFDGRSDCWVWGAYARSWGEGIQKSALELIKECQRQGIDIYRYGADLVEMAKIEKKINIWAVRFLYWHIVNGGLCMRPPYCIVEHIGFDVMATNANKDIFGSPTLPSVKGIPQIPKTWPEPIENPELPSIWKKYNGGKPDILPRRAVKIFLRKYNSLYNHTLGHLMGK